MRMRARCVLQMAILLFSALVFVPTLGMATDVQNCPSEPNQNVPLVSGRTYSGNNCLISSVGDINSFQFSASAGNTYRVVAALGTIHSTNICVALYAPGLPANLIFSGCTCWSCSPVSTASFGADQTLNVTGLYTVVVTEASNALVDYALSLERLYPAPPDAMPLALGQTTTAKIAASSAQNAFTFNGYTSGTYRITTSLAVNPLYDVCFEVYRPDGTAAVPVPPSLPPCTHYNSPPLSYTTIQSDITPTQNGTYTIVAQAGFSAGNNNGSVGIVDYSVNVSCLVGSCSAPAPPTFVRSGVFAHVAAGAGWTTAMSISNPSATPVALNLVLHGNDGNSLVLPITTTQQGLTQTTTGTSVTANIGAYATILISIGNQVGPVLVGWADVLSSSPVIGFAIFRSTQPTGSISEGTVILETQLPSATVLPYDNSGGFATGIALANLSSSSNITATVWDDAGIQVASQVLAVAAGGHSSFFLSDLLPPTVAKRGIVKFQSTSGGSVAGLGLRFSPFSTFTSVPSIPSQ